jgi:hypothetical protein
MKLILFSFMVIFMANQTIACLVRTFEPSECRFFHRTVGPDDEIAINPEDADSSITSVWFMFSSIYSVSPQVFTKFPNIKDFYADGQNVRKIKPDTFKDGKKLEWINLGNNALTFLHRDTFEGWIFSLLSHKVLINLMFCRSVQSAIHFAE